MVKTQEETAREVANMLKNRGQGIDQTIPPQPCLVTIEGVTYPAGKYITTTGTLALYCVGDVPEHRSVTAVRYLNRGHVWYVAAYAVKETVANMAYGEFYPFGPMFVMHRLRYLSTLMHTLPDGEDTLTYDMDVAEIH